MIKLKLTYSRLSELPDLIRNYVDHLCLLMNNNQYTTTPANPNYWKMQISVGGKLFENINKKLLNQFPNKTYTLRLYNFEVIFLMECLKNHFNTTQNDYTRAISQLIYTELKSNITNIKL